MDKLAYHYNKKKFPAKTEGKYLYYYPCADLEYANVQMGGRGFVTVEVTEQEWEALLELDRIEYNNQHKFARHTSLMPDGEEDTLPIKQQEQLHTKDVSIPTVTADKFDKQARFNQLSDRDKKIISLLEEGCTQKEIAEILGVTQGYVSMAKQQAQFNLDYIEYRSAVKVNESEYIWKCWNSFSKRLEMPLFFDVELEFVINYLHPKDIQYFMYWYYSFGEFIRYSLTYYLYNEDKLKEEMAEYFSKASDQELGWFLTNYADKAPLVQIVYIRLISEIARRKDNQLHGSMKAVEGLMTAIEKIAIKAHIPAEQYFAEKIYPMIANIRNRRMKQFYRFYTGKKLLK